MRVLHIGKFYPPRYGGMETAIGDICESMAQAAQIRALVANHGGGECRELLRGVEVVRLKTLGTLASQPLTPGLWREIRSAPADIVHLHEPNPLAMASLLASGHTGRLVVHYHSDIVKQKRLAKLYAPILTRGLRRASAIVVGSRELIESSSVLARWRSKCEVIPFGIDLEPFLGIERETPAQGEPLTVLAVGRLSYYKGFQYLIEAASMLDLRVVIVGDGELRPALERQIAERGVASRVTIAGRVDDARLRRYYAEASIFCLSSCERSEAFGLVQLEAMGAALPVVSTDLPTGVRAINLHGRTGLVVPPHDARALARAIAELAADPGLRHRLGQAGRARAVAEFDRAVMASRILRLYRRVLASQELASHGQMAGSEVAI